MSESKKLRPFRRYDLLTRSLFEIDHGGHRWSIDVDYLEVDSKIVLYRDGEEHDKKRSPARFEIGDDAVIEATVGNAGMKRLHLVTDSGETMLTPVTGSGEAWRARFAREHPGWSRFLGLISWSIVVFGLVTQVPVIIEWVAPYLGFEFESPFTFPSSVNTALMVLTAIAAGERGLRYKSNPIFD